MKLFCRLTLASALGVIVTAIPANAATVVQSLTLTDIFDSSPQDADVVFSIKFDNRDLLGKTPTRFSLLSTSLSGPLQIRHNYLSNDLNLALLGSDDILGICLYITGGFCTFMDNSSAFPDTEFFKYYNSSSQFIFADDVTFLNTNSAVPETVKWAMMLAGFGMMSAGLRYRLRSSTVDFA